MLQLTKKVKWCKQEQHNQEMKWLLKQQEAAAKLKELTDQTSAQDKGNQQE